jgi:ribosomal protein S16
MGLRLAFLARGETTSVAVKIRLKRMGKIRTPFYRVVVMDSRTKRDGRAIEEIGKYHPTEEPSVIDIDPERAAYWLAQGAQPTEAVEALLKVTGDWQKFKGIDGAEGTLRVAKPQGQQEGPLRGRRRRCRQVARAQGCGHDRASQARQGRGCRRRDHRRPGCRRQAGRDR